MYDADFDMVWQCDVRRFNANILHINYTFNVRCLCVGLCTLFT